MVKKVSKKTPKKTPAKLGIYEPDRVMLTAAVFGVVTIVLFALLATL